MFHKVEKVRCRLLINDDQEIDIYQYIPHRFYIINKRACKAIARFICRKENYQNVSGLSYLDNENIQDRGCLF